MSERSRIGWTQATWNPTTGCDRTSPGCANCYAAAMAARLKAMGSAKYQRDGNPLTSGPGFGVATHPDTLRVPYRWRTPRTVFVDSMSDLFHAKVPEAFIRDVFAVMAGTPRHTYQVLTKRAGRLRRLADTLDWPPNVWVGVSVEDATRLHRVADLRAVPAAVRFISAEPLLGPLHGPLLGPGLSGLDLTGIAWVITGGETGPHARPIDPDWVRAIRDATQACGAAFFHKAWGGPRPHTTGRALDGRTWDQTPTTVLTAAASAGRVGGRPGPVRPARDHDPGRVG